MAFSPSGPIKLPGKSLRPEAPALMAAKHSVGVMTPGQVLGASTKPQWARA